MKNSADEKAAKQFLNSDACIRREYAGKVPLKVVCSDEEITKDYYKIIKPFIAKEYLLQNNQSENRTTVTDGYFF